MSAERRANSPVWIRVDTPETIHISDIAHIGNLTRIIWNAAPDRGECSFTFYDYKTDKTFKATKISMSSFILLEEING